MADEHPNPAAHTVTGPVHVIALTETGPRIFEVRCTACHVPNSQGAHVHSAACHRVTWTPWGEQHAHEIGDLHVFYMEHPEAPRLHHQPYAMAGRVR